MSNGKRKLSALLITSLICAGLAFADTYKNNVVDVRVNNENGNAVKVVIYTDKPYTDPVVVNKKANNKYVILLPETNSVLKASPTVTNGAGTISNVSVNTQSVSGGKGYTKITITSEKAINVVPRTQQVISKVKPAPTTTTTTLSTTKPVNLPSATKQADAQKLAQQKAQQEAKKKAEQAKQEKLKQEQAKKLAQQKAQASKPVSTPAKPQAQPSKQPIEVLEQEIKTGQYANVSQDKNDEVLNKEIKENLINDSKKKQPPLLDENKNKSAAENIKTLLKDNNWSIWKILLLAGAVTFPILVIMVILGMDKKINKKIDATFKREEEEVGNYIPPVAPTPEPEPQNEPQSEPVMYNSFDNMLDMVQEHEPEITYQEQISNMEPPPAQPVNEPDTYEFVNDYKVDDFEPETGISSNTAETIPEPEPEPVIEPEPVQEPEPYNPDGYLADFGGINDKDFFDELAMQAMAENNTEGLPEQSPADQVFDFMHEETPEPTAEVPPQIEFEPEPVQVTETNTEQTDGLTMLTEVRLNETTGMYLVNYDNFSSLVGHINDDYFVLKKFDEIVTGNIFYKEAEKLQGAKRYLVRVGKNKMVIEVSPTSMTKLIDL